MSTRGSSEAPDGKGARLHLKSRNLGTETLQIPLAHARVSVCKPVHAPFDGAVSARMEYSGTTLDSWLRQKADHSRRPIDFDRQRLGEELIEGLGGGVCPT